MHDVIVIGGGSGGYAAAVGAAQLGGKAALVECGEIGSACIDRGCIPGEIRMRPAAGVRLRKKVPEFGMGCGGGAHELRVMSEGKTGHLEDCGPAWRRFFGVTASEVIRGHAILRSTRRSKSKAGLFETERDRHHNGQFPLHFQR